MRTNYSLLLLLFILVSAATSPRLSAETIGKKKPVSKNSERQKEYQAAAGALKNQTFLISLYSFVDVAGKMVNLEPEGNFITVNKDKFMMQKSVSLKLNAFSGTDNIKGEFTDFKVKESKKGNIRFSFVISVAGKVLSFKGNMRKGDNVIEGRLKGDRDEHEIFLSGNVQPVKSRFEY